MSQQYNAIAKVSESVKKQIRSKVQSGDYVNESDFVRSAVLNALPGAGGITTILTRKMRAEVDDLVDRGLYLDDADVVRHALEAEISRHNEGV